MKVLFIGEGSHDIGDSSPNPYHPRPARGTIPTLVRGVWAGIAPESVALAWRELSRFSPSAQKRGYGAKVVAAALLAVRKFNYGATVVVADRDGNAGRQAELEAAVDSARQLFPGHSATWGLAVESVEAWTLGVPDKLAEELDVDVELVQKLFPRGAHVESLSERSGKLDHRPKQLLERIAQLKHRHDSTECREAIAERTDVAILAQALSAGLWTLRRTASESLWTGIMNERAGFRPQQTPRQEGRPSVQGLSGRQLALGETNAEHVGAIGPDSQPDAPGHLLV